VLRFAKGDQIVGPGFLDDHAFLAAAALALYEATGDERRLLASRRIADRLLEQFSDGSGTFFFTPASGEKLIVRVEDPFDQAIPAGAAVAASVLLRLGSLIDASYSAPAERYLERMAPAALENPFAFSYTIGALDYLVRGSTDVVILGSTQDPAARALHRAALRTYLPNRNIVWADPTRPSSLAAAERLTAGKPAGSRPTAYVCRARTCSPPISDPEQLAQTLGPKHTSH